MSALLDSNADYRKVKIVKVDWDQFSKAPIRSELKVARRSTLIMFNGGKEVGRVIASTDTRSIENLFKAAT